MHLSKLQKYILITCFEAGAQKRHDRSLFYSFYSKPGKIEKETVMKSLNRLIIKGYLVGFGEFTQTKNYIFKVKITSLGSKIARSLRGKQLSIKYKVKK